MANYPELLRYEEVVSGDPVHVGNPTPLMRTHTVTVYNAVGEVDRQATFVRTVLRGVRCERSKGAVATILGQTATDGLVVFIPPMTLYVEPKDYAGEGWTLRPGDIVVVGECESEVPKDSTIAALESTREVYKITGVKVCELVSRLHHFEVAAA